MEASNSKERIPVDAFMVVATFKPETDMAHVFAVVAEEQARVSVLEAEGKVGQIFLSLARGTVFIQAFAAHAEEARDTVLSLPMAQWWDLELFPLGAPTAPEATS